MSETASQRTARLLNMSNAQLIMHAQDLTKQRDELISDLATAEQDSRQKQARIDRLERERDELLAALEGLNKVCEIALAGKNGKQHAYFETRAGHFVEATEAMRTAEAAIASVKGGAEWP